MFNSQITPTTFVILKNKLYYQILFQAFENSYDCDLCYFLWQNEGLLLSIWFD